MLRKVALFITLLVAMALPALADDVASPPNNATLVGTGNVAFRWKGTAKAYYIEVYAAGQPVYSQPVPTTSISLPLRPGPPYQWLVKAYDGKQFQEIVPRRRFELSATVTYDFGGADGSAGAVGGSASSTYTINTSNQVGFLDGPPGGAGARGNDVDVTLQPAGDYMQVTLTSGNSSQRFLLLATSTPIVVDASGGNGGTGGSGGNGLPGVLNPMYNSSGVVVSATARAAGNGGNGGIGGAGGNGGTVRVHGNGVDGKRYVKARVDGGTGGTGGAAGRGGPAAPSGTYASSSGGVYVYGSGSTPGRDGAPGAAGAAGREGSVLYD